VDPIGLHPPIYQLKELSQHLHEDRVSFIKIIYKNSVSASQKAQYISFTGQIN
jgi:hypothetical protein